MGPTEDTVIALCAGLRDVESPAGTEKAVWYCIAVSSLSIHYQHPLTIF